MTQNSLDGNVDDNGIFPECQKCSNVTHFHPIPIIGTRKLTLNNIIYLCTLHMHMHIFTVLLCTRHVR